ncbi:MAG: ATP-binding protein, partial [Bacteroidales bacterium]|nr:ATP-binding protein [Bacteroidales bacterium]
SRESEEQIIKAIDTCKKSGSISDFEITFEKPNGQNSYILMNALLETELEASKIFAICRDITDRKLYEEKLKAAKIKAEEADKLKSAFLANMSHEIRTPMNAIVGFADLLGRDSLSPEERETYVKIIKGSSNSLLGLINDIIDLSKIEVEKISINRTDFNINQVMQELFSSYKNIRQTDVEIIFDNLNDKNLTNITSDPLRFKQVFTNLIDNAIKFTEKGKINFGFKKKDQLQLLFYVSDTGIGIPQNKQQIIFDRFRKLEDSGSKLYRGTGLGLTISKKLIQLLGGDMWVESEPGKGSKFYFTLPYHKEIVLNSEEKENSDPFDFSELDLKDKTILIVEDEDLNYLFLEKLLKSSNATIYRAFTGLEAVKIIEEDKKVDLILMDIKLPVMDGIEATKEIKIKNPGIPILAQTAFAMKGDQERFMKAGCDDYIAKPIKVENLFRKLNFYLNENK